MRLYIAGLLGLLCAIAAQAVPAYIALHTAAQVKRLAPEESRRRQPVTLHGIVTQIMPEWGSFSLQDGTEGIYVAAGQLPAGLRIGSTVLVEGVTSPGNFAPSVRANRIAITGHGALPAPRRLSWEDLTAGRCDNNLVETEGVVRTDRAVTPPAWDWPAAALRIDLGGKFLRVYVRDTKALPANLVDATVRVRGVCIVLSNSQRQFESLALNSGSAADIAVLQAPPPDTFDAPLASIGSLFEYEGRAASLHRVRVRGIVTARHSGDVYLQDGAHALAVHAASVPAVRPGDRAEAVGFPVASGFATVLDDALIRIEGHDQLPAPLKLAASSVLASVSHAPSAPIGVLVRLDGRVTESGRSAKDASLVINDGGATFTAVLPGGGASLAKVEIGSRIAVTGVCTAQLDEQGVPASFGVLMRSAADAVVLERAPRITVRTAGQAALALLAFLLTAIFWVTTLRRRVAKQTSTIRHQFAREVALQQRYRDLVENASDLVYVRDLRGRLLHVNRGAAEITGYSREELLGANIVDLLAPEERERAGRELATPPEHGATLNSEWRFLTRDGKEIVVETKERFLQEDSEPARVECIGRDVTARHRAQSDAIQDRNRLEEQLQHSQKLESVGQLAGGVAHDFNNLLTVISGYSQLLAEELPPGELRQRAAEILQAAERAGGLTRQLLLFSRRKRPALKTLSLNEVLSNLEKMLRRLIGEDIALTLSLDAGPSVVRADAGHIEQAVMNLALNARDAMPQGGTLEIRTSDFHASAEFAAANVDVQEGPYVALEVEDSGGGIPEDLRARIFEPFFTTKEQGKGTGLGLSIVYGIVKQANGAIWVESAPGRTVFRILIPAAEREDEPEVAALPDAAAQNGTETILLAEDEEGVRSFVREVLRLHGYTVLEAATGIEALRIATEHPGQIDLLLTDLVMPEMGGAELALQFAEVCPGVPVLHMTGYSDRPLKLNSAAELLQKPFTPGGLLAGVRARLNGRGGATASAG